MSSCPYDDVPDTSWWSRSVANRDGAGINPHSGHRRFIDRSTKVASAGSCFAQHISRELTLAGYSYFVTEPAPSFFSEEQARAFNFRTFSARYGNVYTPLQLLQLVERAFGERTPVDQFWMSPEGRCFDLLRPRIQPNGFSSIAEAKADLTRHLGAVRRLFTEADVFVFTLGLTEGWVSTADGTAYPTCPGCGSAGEYSPEKYEFRNLSVGDATEALAETMQRLNPKMQVIFTVSPVPLLATMTDRHVLQATTYSKSVLRVAAEEMAVRFANAHYFGSYEIVTATCNTKDFFGEDRRTVKRHAVDRVMECFFDYFCEDSLPAAKPSPPSHEPLAQPQVICDEEEFFASVASR